MWRALADAGLPSQLKVTSDTNRPHITLIAAERIDPGIDEELTWLAAELPLPAVLGAPLVFGGDRMTLARLVIPSDALLASHELVYDLCLPYVTNRVRPQRPGPVDPARHARPPVHPSSGG